MKHMLDRYNCKRKTEKVWCIGNHQDKINTKAFQAKEGNGEVFSKKIEIHAERL